MKLTRREALAAGMAAATGGCVLKAYPPPRIEHPRTARVEPARRAPGPGEILAGAARVDITPAGPTWLAGFGFQRAMHGIRDPISASALYLDDGERRVALVVADVIGLSNATVGRVRRLVGGGIEVCAAATHDHHGPDTLGFWGPSLLYLVPHRSGIDPPYLARLERRLAGAVAAAAARARPATISLAVTELPKGVARNLRRPDPYDPQLLALAIDGPGGAPIATLIDFACHPETLGDRSHLLSADFPGALRAHVDAIRGGVTVFANGSLGGMVVPDAPEGGDEEERGRYADAIGRTAGDAALAALARAEPVEVRRVAYTRAEVELDVSNDLFRMIERLGLVEPRARGESGGFLTEVGRLDIGPVAFALLPGEPTPAVGELAKKALDAPHAAVIGLAVDELGYLLDPAQYVDPRFEYEVSMSVGRGASPALLAALERLPRTS